jgi:hypothetical protein
MGLYFSNVACQKWCVRMEEILMSTWREDGKIEPQ